MGRSRKRGRDVHGVLPLDKPLGMSSNQALQRVRRLFDARKAGHTGSLDPLASGVLPLCLGEATKLSAFLLDADKTYEFDCQLGTRTSTGDAEGEVVESAEVPTLDEARLESVLADFRGDIEQIPPMYSALKHKGERLYRLAREGVEVEREPRRVTIHALSCLAINPPVLSLRAQCSKGTYIRVLAEDIAAALGTVGHVSRLRRVGAGPYSEDELVSLEAVEEAAEQGQEALDALLQPADTALAGWESVNLSADMDWYFRQGQAVQVAGAPVAGRVRVYAEDRGFLGIGEILDDGRVAPKRLLHTG
ncbi:tRNA pseudouridine(55) synthase TruB [Gammaproteobacteria bacterium AB-CW1]|uniref:tRNA pseudouridine synthase B n=1 Tax=Natronospira elongata TaxID=3110268 RepID=A0AAP6MLE8_9GAMM|nr:tRNA pseudouridine(55) synthase TruB [Gammaproteobacteria bacterium AB-CW1]